jgi:hypothetical protein
LSQLETSLGAFEIDLTAEEYEALNHLFATEIYEEGLQLFPGLTYNFPRLRRNLNLLD